MYDMRMSRLSRRFSGGKYTLVTLVVADRLHLLLYQRHRPGKELIAHFNHLVSRKYEYECKKHAEK